MTRAAWATRWGWVDAFSATLGGNDAEHRRMVSTYLAARVVLALGLLLAAAALAWWRQTPPSPWTLAICAIYAVLTLLWWGVALRSQRLPQVRSRAWWLTLAIDVATFAALHWVDPSGGSANPAALLVLPVLMAGVGGPTVPALATAAAAALALLAGAVQRLVNGEETSLTLLSQTGLAGLGMFAVALLALQVARWVAREQRSARGSLALARQHIELSRLVIEDMAEGVLVVDAIGRVHAANPAARLLLAGPTGECPLAPFELGLDAGWRPVQDAAWDALGGQPWPDEGREVGVTCAGGPLRMLLLRAKVLRDARSDATERLAVLFLEDVRQVQARQRQQQLAVMGRFSAAVAHEIRNPLAAIAQAGTLLGEDALRRDQQRLVAIVTANVERLQRLVDDVMEAAPGVRSPSHTLNVDTELGQIVADWRATTPGADGPRLTVVRRADGSAPLGVAFDTEHLRRVLVNLLDNAWRHSSEAQGAIALTLSAPDARTVQIDVASDGTPIPPEVQAHLFEPFHSTRSRGTGLGLYICRELCVRHRGQITYTAVPNARHANLFSVTLRRVALVREGQFQP